MFERIFAKIRMVHMNHPELRFNQIMSIAAKKAGWIGDDLFYCPDNTIEKGLDMLLDNNR